MLISRILDGKGEIRSEYLGAIIKDLLNKTFEIPEQYDAVIVEVDDEYKARPDLFAKDICGDESYAEVICKLNGISNPFEFQSGTYMLVPDISSLSKFIIKPSAGWAGGIESTSGMTGNGMAGNGMAGNAGNAGNGMAGNAGNGMAGNGMAGNAGNAGNGMAGNIATKKPEPKSRTDRRKPNEAVTGDRRFNIDPVSKIVIY